MTLYVTLPNFFENLQVNSFLKEYNYRYPEEFIENIVFIQESGQFPHCIFNGGINRNFPETVLYNNIYNFNAQNIKVLRLNCANNFLEKTDYNDIMANVILTACHNGSNLIEISNLELMDYIVGKYPNYKFVLSAELDNIMPFDANLINNFIQSQKFELISLPSRLNTNIELLTQINQRNKLEINVNPMCPVHCKMYSNCIDQEHKLQLLYSKNNIFSNCNRTYGLNTTNKGFISIEKLKEIYTPLGINHITFSPYLSPNLINFYIEYFIKPEFQGKCLMAFQKGF